MSTASSTGKPRLFGLQGSYAGTSFDLNDDLVTIGREPGNTVTLNNDSTISRRHAQLARQAGAYTLTDFESSNGTFVNDVKITGECVVRPGDTVQFGMSKFKLEG
jgi:pSer/pThr/pTyr-binding forkhead associated (FHA) protein